MCARRNSKKGAFGVSSGFQQRKKSAILPPRECAFDGFEKPSCPSMDWQPRIRELLVYRQPWLFVKCKLGEGEERKETKKDLAHRFENRRCLNTHSSSDINVFQGSCLYRGK